MMAKEIEVWEILRDAGYTPIKNQSIIVAYTPAELSSNIANFFEQQFYVLQICENELVLVPFGSISLNLKKEGTLALPFDTIQEVQVEKQRLNVVITIVTETDTIKLTAQQKLLSEFRSSGVLAGQINFMKNWHKENFDETIAALMALS